MLKFQGPKKNFVRLIKEQSISSIPQQGLLAVNPVVTTHEYMISQLFMRESLTVLIGLNFVLYSLRFPLMVSLSLIFHYLATAESLK
jgi:hypothetical protein